MRVVTRPDHVPSPISCVAVVGTSGCGKSTFARNLAARAGLPHVELDAIHWNNDWTESPDDEFNANFDRATDAGRWVIDGNYGRRGMQERIFDDADLVVWLDLPFTTIFRRICVRSVRRAATKETLWGTNNHESFRLLLTSKYSMPLWVIKTFRLRRRQFAALEEPDIHPETALLRIRSPRRTMTWLDAIARVSSREPTATDPP